MSTPWERCCSKQSCPHSKARRPACTSANGTQSHPATYSAVGTNGSATPGAYVPPPMISYEDLGLTMKVTHRFHVGGEVTMEVDAEFSC